MTVSHASFIPYRRTGAGYEFYLQKRDAHAPGDANIFSTFGGHVDKGETELEAAYREIFEELRYKPKALQKLGYFEVRNNTFAVFYERVRNDFENLVEVCEGEYGRFLTEDEIAARDDISQLLRTVIPPLVAHISKNEGKE